MQSRLHQLRIAGFFRPPIPAPVVHRSSSRHRSDSDCVGCGTFALAYATTQVPWECGILFLTSRMLQPRKTSVSNFDQFLQVRILTLSLGLGVGPCTRPST
jgi:hypothetical protein